MEAGAKAIMISPGKHISYVRRMRHKLKGQLNPKLALSDKNIVSVVGQMFSNETTVFSLNGTPIATQNRSLSQTGTDGNSDREKMPCGEQSTEYKTINLSRPGSLNEIALNEKYPTVSKPLQNFFVKGDL